MRLACIICVAILLLAGKVHAQQAPPLPMCARGQSLPTSLVKQLLADRFGEKTLFWAQPFQPERHPRTGEIRHVSLASVYWDPSDGSWTALLTRANAKRSCLFTASERFGPLPRAEEPPIDPAFPDIRKDRAFDIAIRRT